MVPLLVFIGHVVKSGAKAIYADPMLRVDDTRHTLMLESTYVKRYDRKLTQICRHDVFNILALLEDFICLLKYDFHKYLRNMYSIT